MNLDDATRRASAATDDPRPEPITYETPVTLGMLLDIARDAHRSRHMPDAPPLLALAYIEAIEGMLEGRCRV